MKTQGPKLRQIKNSPLVTWDRGHSHTRTHKNAHTYMCINVHTHMNKIKTPKDECIIKNYKHNIKHCTWRGNQSTLQREVTIQVELIN